MYGLTYTSSSRPLCGCDIRSIFLAIYSQRRARYTLYVLYSIYLKKELQPKKIVFTIFKILAFFFLNYFLSRKRVEQHEYNTYTTYNVTISSYYEVVRYVIIVNRKIRYTVGHRKFNDFFVTV